MKFRILLIALALAIALPAAHASGNDFRTGYDAFRSGDYARALQVLRPLAERGHAGAQHVLGVMHYAGRGVPTDNSEALKWFRMAADRGVPESQFALGTMYFNGTGVSQDFAKAEIWLRKSALQGHPTAQYNLGFLHSFGAKGTLLLDDEIQSTARDIVRGFAWLYLAAESGVSQAVSLKDRVQRNLTHDEEAKAWQLISEFRTRIGAARRR